MASRKKQSPRPGKEPIKGPHSVSSTSDRSISAKIVQTLGSLPDAEKCVLVWSYGLFGEPQLPIEEIGTRMNMTAGAVRITTERALNSMRAGLNELGVA